MLEKLKQEIANIKQRNKKVEADKAWETSLFRKISILISTYLLASLVMYVIKVERVFFNALIPTLGYFLSTLTMPLLKKWWITVYYEKNN